MTEIPLIWKIIISLIFLLMFAVSAFLGWRLFWIKEKFKLLQSDRNELLEERAKQSNKLRLKGIEIDESNREKFILSELEKRMILNALNMPQYKNAIEDPKETHVVRMAYRNLRARIKESLD